MKENGTLSVVATPIGNLGDITLRALETLRAADVIACEDTRVTSKLLARYEIKKPLLRYDARTARVSGARVLAQLAEGKRIALVTDGGTPGISDPGTEMVARAREAGARIEVIPGPSALVAALSGAGIPCSEFLFLGFLPHKKGRQSFFKEIAREKRTVVFYESPHRLSKALSSLVEVLPASRTIVVARELTKLHESFVAGSAAHVLAQFQNHPETERGELVVIVSPW